MRHAQSILDFYNSNLFTQCTHEANLWYSDAVIDAGIADLVLLIDVTNGHTKNNMPKEMQNAKKLYPATF
ncbi:unannotated protein [freshwater metagenome]|uniref:Unannotated protein n=1 Tax=freshwater metagenome TaxID=449393 RepID=A0A6J6IYP7_9ZZZZ